MKSHLIVSGVVLTAVVMAAAIGQEGRMEAESPASPSMRSRTQSATPQAMLQRIRDLESRVERLEARAMLLGDSNIQIEDRDLTGAELEVEPGENVMQLDGFEIVQPKPEDYERLEQLREEADALGRRVDTMRRKVASLSGSGGYRGSSYSRQSSRQRTAQAQLLAQYEKEFRAKEGEAKRLEREIERPKQIVHGHWGSRIISLRTTTDLSSVLSRVDDDAYLTWTGRRMRLDDNAEEWVVTSIRPYELPGEAEE